MHESYTVWGIMNMLCGLHARVRLCFGCQTSFLVRIGTSADLGIYTASKASFGHSWSNCEEFATPSQVSRRDWGDRVWSVRVKVN